MQLSHVPHGGIAVQNNPLRKYKVLLAVFIPLCCLFLSSTIVLSILLGTSNCASDFLSGQKSVEEQLIGNWTTDRGMDSRYMNFKSNGHVTYGDFLDSYDRTYTLSSDNDLKIESYGSYTYSEKAKKSSSSSYWYIDDNTLYLGTQIYYRKK